MVEIGCVVIPTAGKEKGRFMTVVRQENGIWLADGRHRRLESPKRKNPRHFAVTPYRVDTASMTTNRTLRRALTACQQAAGATNLCPEPDTDH